MTTKCKVLRDLIYGNEILILRPSCGVVFLLLCFANSIYLKT